jgi:hypothetical protein
MKKIFQVISVILIVAYMIGLFPKQKLYTEITIDASSEKVWKVLTAFNEYSEWNPFIKSISGDVSVGSQLSVSIQPPGGDAMDFAPKILVANKNVELRWLGRVLMPKLFDGEHFFKIIKLPGDKVQFIQGEQFSGILALLLWGSMKESTEQGFIDMNKALKDRCEN